MSMLAERKRKQRWSLNPRGKFWREDANGFGQKMLEKMGWKHGKGLGANEDGTIESIKVAYKNDSQGIGYKGTEEWLACEDNFSSLLENLNNKSEKASSNIKITSLEQKVQNSKARINYHKFTKAKDLSRYSEKDLANIFGKKSLKKEVVEEIANNEHEEISESKEVKNDILVNKGSMTDYFKKKLTNLKKTTDSCANDKKEEINDKVNDDILISKGSMADYFQKKLPNFGRVVTSRNIVESESDNERVGFGFSQTIPEDSEENKNVLQETKKKKRKYAEISISNDGPTEDLKESKKQKKDKSIGNFISYIYKDDVIQDNIQENMGAPSIVEHKKKKKNQKNLDNDQSENGCKEDNLKSERDVIENNNMEEHVKKKSKSKNKRNIVSNENIEVLDQELVRKDISNNLKRKKLKNNKLSPIGEVIEEVNNQQSKFSNEDYNEDINQVNSNELCQENEEEAKITSKKQKRLKKKKYEETESIGISNLAFCDFDSSNFKEPVEEENGNSEIGSEESNETMNVAIESKKKKSRKGNIKHPEIEIKIENSEEQSKELLNEIPQEQIEENETKQPRKKRKKSRTNEESSDGGISNAAFSDFNSNPLNNSALQAEDENNETSTSIDTPKKKKKKRRNQDISNDGIDNPTFNILVDTSSNIEESSNPYEVPNKKKKKKSSKKEDTGLDNPALNLSDVILDSDLMLNVVNEPVILKKKFALNSSTDKVKNTRRKSVRFNNVLQEKIIPNDPSERMNEYISNRNELFDINTMVIEEGIKEEMEKQGITYERDSKSIVNELTDPQEINRKVVESSVKEELNRGLNTQSGFVNNGFDIRSVDKVNFYDGKYEIKSSPSKDNGVDNKAFNNVKIHIEENIESISNTIDKYQAEVENDINESKDVKFIPQMNQPWLVGDVGSQISRNIRIEEGTKLCFKEMHFKTPIPHYLRGNNISRPKKTYRHLIRGDITVVFKNANLHDIEGYAVKSRESVMMR